MYTVQVKAAVGEEGGTGRLPISPLSDTYLVPEALQSRVAPSGAPYHHGNHGRPCVGAGSRQLGLAIGQCRASSRVTSHMESATLRSGGARRGESPFIMALTLHAGQWAVGQGDAGAPAADPTRDRRNEYALTRKAREQNVPGGAPGSKGAGGGSGGREEGGSEK